MDGGGVNLREEELRAAARTAVKELRDVAGQVSSDPRTMRWTLKDWVLQIAAKLERELQR